MKLTMILAVLALGARGLAFAQPTDAEQDVSIQQDADAGTRAADEMQRQTGEALRWKKRAAPQKDAKPARRKKLKARAGAARPRGTTPRGSGTPPAGR